MHTTPRRLAAGLVLATVMALAGCGDGSGQTPPDSTRPAAATSDRPVDRSTPQNTIDSFIAFLNSDDSLTEDDLEPWVLPSDLRYLHDYVDDSVGGRVTIDPYLVTPAVHQGKEVYDISYTAKSCDADGACAVQAHEGGLDVRAEGGQYGFRASSVWSLVRGITDDVEAE